MSVFSNIFNGMARGFAFGMFGANPFWGGCCCNTNLLYYTPNPFMAGGFFPVMPPISMPIFDMTPPQSAYRGLDFSSMQFNVPSISDLLKYYNSRNEEKKEEIGDIFTPSKKTEEAKKTGAYNQEKKTYDKNTSFLSTKDKYFTEMLSFIVDNLEGGYANVKYDRGGKTYHGVTTATYNSYRQQKGLPTQDVRKMTNEEMVEIYHNIYVECGADKIDNPRLAYYVFDVAVGSGSKAAKKILKESGGDLAKFEQLRRQKYKNIVANDPTQAKFLKGWNNRVDKSREFAMSKLPESMSSSTA